MSLSAYLAKNYLTASSDPNELSTRPKKRRKKDKSQIISTGLTIADDEDDLHLSSIRNEDEDPDRPIFDSSTRSAEFRRAKKNNWQALQNAEEDAAAADQILAAAAAENGRAQTEVEMDDAPAIVNQTEVEAAKMEGGKRAGLQTAADTAALELREERRKNAERKANKLQKQLKQDIPERPPEEQTVYRDATGRRIDISMKRAEARKAAEEAVRAEQKAKEDAMGAVQLREKQQRKEDLEEAKFLTVARGEDDEEMNEELKQQMRWDDPMAGYMMRKEVDEAKSQGKAGGKGKGGVGVVTVRKKEYTGAAPPNRYGIKPGWRWDGVDRGNGFEKEWFQARGKKDRVRDSEYQWQMDE